jgi:hypothetical protein
MAEALRIGLEQARQKVQSGSALLVCAYDDDEVFRQMHLEGAISLSEFRSRLPSLSKTQDIVFYCA